MKLPTFEKTTDYKQLSLHLSISVVIFGVVTVAIKSHLDDNIQVLNLLYSVFLFLIIGFFLKKYQFLFPIYLEKRAIKEVHYLEAVNFAFTPGRVYIEVEFPIGYKASFPDSDSYVIQNNYIVPMYISKTQVKQKNLIEFPAFKDHEFSFNFSRDMASGVDVFTEYTYKLTIYRTKFRTFGLMEVEKCSI